MFTRFIAVVAFLIFIISFGLLVVVWGENGLMARQSLERERVATEEVLRQKEGEVERLRSKDLSSAVPEESDRTLVHVFQNSEIYGPEVTVQTQTKAFRGLSPTGAAAIALGPTVIFLVLRYLLDKRRKRRKPRRRQNVSYDD